MIVKYSFADISSYPWYRHIDGCLPYRIEKFYEDGSSCLIVAFEDNPDYKEYLAWLDAGNLPEEWTPEETE